MMYIIYFFIVVLFYGVFIDTRSIHATSDSPLKEILFSPSPAWMQHRIKKDFSRYRSPIKADSINAVWQECCLRYPQKLYFRYQIKNGSIIQIFPMKHHQRAITFTKALKKLLSTIQIKELDFIICLEDSCDEDAFFLKNNVPLLVLSKDRHSQSQVLIPDVDALGGYLNLIKEVNSGNSLFPWDKKTSKGFWRGATTGGDYSDENWPLLPRSKLVLLSLAQPLLIDAKFTKFCQGAEKNKDMLAWTPLRASPVSITHQIKYKYLINVDGNTCAWSRLYWALLSNSVVLHQVTTNIEWYYDILLPNIHFIPIKEDLSNLTSQIQWAKKNDHQAKQIAQEATRFANKHLNETQIYLYLYLVLHTYSELQFSTNN